MAEKYSSQHNPRSILPTLDKKTHKMWVHLSQRAQFAAVSISPCSVNPLLEVEINKEPDAPTAAAYRLWTAENLAREGRFAESLPLFDQCRETAARVDQMSPNIDLIQAALQNKAQAAQLANDIDSSLEAYKQLAKQANDPSQSLYEAGHVAEMAGRFTIATDLYRQSCGQRETHDIPTTEAERALARLKDEKGLFFPGPAKLADHLGEALRNQDSQMLLRLISRTHFTTGLAGGHSHFDDPSVLNHLCTELSRKRIKVQRKLLGSGNKRYLFSEGWRGLWFRDRVGLVLTNSGRGWQWTGIAVTVATKPWRKKWSTDRPETNQPLSLPILAPWPAGDHFMAGGLADFAIKSGVVVAAGIFGGPIALGFSAAKCGYGTRGFYYNSSLLSTHQDENAFAIDFTRYRRFAPFDPESGGTPILVVADGTVTIANGGTMSGDDENNPNTVEIEHLDPATNQSRFVTRYLHMTGPYQLSVSTGMYVRTGMRVGLMNDTGQKSVLDHLHFSIHDKNIPYANFSRGASVRPSPMDGQTLNDGDSGKCISSSNVEFTPVASSIGQITMLRVHELETGFGPAPDFLDSEVVVILDNESDQYFGLQLRDDKPLPANQSMFVLLRHAFNTDTSVHIEWLRVSESGRKIIRVQLDTD